MKLTPKIYALLLIESLKSDQPEKIASKFWYLLQKNGQYKDLAKIINRLDQEYASSLDMILADVYSAEVLDDEHLAEIKNKLEKRFAKKVIIKNIAKKRFIGGIVVKVNDVEIDLSIEGKIRQLRQSLSN